MIHLYQIFKIDMNTPEHEDTATNFSRQDHANCAEKVSTKYRNFNTFYAAG